MAVVPFAGQQNLWLVRLLYSLVFFGLAFLVAQHPDKLSQVLGKVMGPLLLVMIVVLFAACLFAKHPGFANPQGSYAHHQLMQGFIDGYQTIEPARRPLFRHCHLREHLLDGRRRRA